MPWISPSLDSLRSLNRDNIQSMLRSGPMIPNSGLRVMADSNAALAFYTLMYIAWLALQLLPDTAETEWLDRHAAIWLTQGRKTATYSIGTATATGIAGTPIPAGSQLTSDNNSSVFQVNTQIILGVGPTSFNFTALTSGVTGLSVSDTLAFSTGIAGVSGTAPITSFTDGIAGETDDELRSRVLARIQQPPVGGDADDYVAWVKATSGVPVTRAWCSPLEMGPGTVTLRFMCDDVINNKVVFPTATQIAAVLAYVNTVRPVAIKDLFVVAPIPFPINFSITNLVPDTSSVRSAIAVSVARMLYDKAAPASASSGVSQPATTIFQSWVSEAVSSVAGVEEFTLGMTDQMMPSGAYLAVLGTIVYA